MVFDKITMKNFQSFGDIEQTISLNRKDISLIIGYNEMNSGNSNGSGKSSFITAILWCIFAKGRNSADDVINKYVGKNCKVELFFEKDKDKYSILRYRKHDEHKSKVYLFKNSKDISFDDNRDTQNLIEKTIGLSLESFTSSLVFSNIYSNFITLTPAKREEIIENMLGLTIIDSYYEKIKELNKKINTKKDTYLKQNNSFNSQLSTLESSLTAYKDNIKNKLTGITNNTKVLQQEKESLISTNVEELLKAKELEKEIQILEKHISLLKTENEDLYLFKSADNVVEIHDLKEKIKKIRDNIDNCFACGQPLKDHSVTENEIKKCEDLINYYQIENEKHLLKAGEIQEKNKEVIKELTPLKSSLDEKKEELKKLPSSSLTLEEIKNINIKITEINNKIEVNSQTIKSLVDKDYVENQNAEIEKTRTEIEKIKTVIEKIEEEADYSGYFTELFGGKGLKKYIVKKILPLLNEKINEFLTFYFPFNITIEFDENFKEVICIGNKEYSIKEFSSGEQRRVEMSCIFALFFLVKLYLGNTSNLLILDEVLDIGFDESGINSTILILEKLKEEGNSIFVISHQNIYKDYFTNRIKVTKNKKGISFVTEEID